MVFLLLFLLPIVNSFPYPSLSRLKNSLILLRNVSKRYFYREKIYTECALKELKIEKDRTSLFFQQNTPCPLSGSPTELKVFNSSGLGTPTTFPPSASWFSFLLHVAKKESHTKNCLHFLHFPHVLHSLHFVHFVHLFTFCTFYTFTFSHFMQI